MPADQVSAEDGWRAELALRFARRGDKTQIIERHHQGPLLIQRPFYPEAGGACHVYVLHPPAGIVGGDRLKMLLVVDRDAHALMTTPGATRWYYSRAKQACAEQSAEVADGATLEWLPQETLLFDGACARLATRIELAAQARFIGWELLGFGRPANSEPFASGQFDFRFELFRGGQPLVLERFRVDGSEAAAGGGLPGMRGATACATMLATPATQEDLETARTVIAGFGMVENGDAEIGATLIGDVLVCRGTARYCEPLQIALRAIWSELRPALLGEGALGGGAAAPRVWRT